MSRKKEEKCNFELNECHITFFDVLHFDLVATTAMDVTEDDERED